MLIRKDKEFSHDASVIQSIVEHGFTTGELKTGFPAEQITNPDNFVSLLYYFGMLTIDGTYKGATKLSIPNLVVREQIYQYLLDTYQENDLAYDSYQLGKLNSKLALTSLNKFYRPISEQDTQAGYVDLFLKPLLETYGDMEHSYIIELKYAKGKDTMERVEQLRQEAVMQANRYADTETVRFHIGHTQLHKIVVVFHGMEMAVCEEV